jgi:hypothetical protein
MNTMHPRKQSGSSLVVVISVLATLMVIVGVAAEYTWTVNRHVQRSNTLQSAVAVGDGCIEILFSNWRKICSAAPLTLQTSNSFSAITLPTASQLNLPITTNFAKRDMSGTWYDPAHDDYDVNFSISNCKVVAVTPEWTMLSSAGAAPIPMLGQIALPSPNPSPTTSLIYNYLASADVTLPALGPTGTVVARVRRVFQKQQMSPWNFAIFYVDPLEIHPGPDFIVTGWVHTNSDLYTGHDSLTLADKVTYGSDWSVGFKPGDGTHPETPSAPTYLANSPPTRDQALQPFGLDSSLIFNNGDANHNNDDSYHELIEPAKTGADPLQGQRYWDQANSTTTFGTGVAIKVDSSNNITIGRPETDGTLTSFTSLLAPSTSGGLPNGDPLRPKYQALYDMFNGPDGPNTATAPITTGVSMGVQDDREGGSVRLVTLNLSKIENIAGLTATYKANSVAPYFNGIVYIYDSSATSHPLYPDGNNDPLHPDGTANLNVNLKDDGTISATAVKRGIRIKGGSKIPVSGLTIASSNPVYVQGDFNTGGNPPSNSGDPADADTPQVLGYKRAPCSILADAVNILSNTWSDGNAGGAPTASNTTVNAAIVSGIVPTPPLGGGGSYSGGAENFPRFLEDWTGKTLTYYGSMVELYKSQQSTGKWTCCSVYSPPIRQWYFDNNFKVTPPPGSIMVYSYIKGKWSVAGN